MGCAVSEFERPMEVVERTSSKKKVSFQDGLMGILGRGPSQTAISGNETPRAGLRSWHGRLRAFQRAAWKSFCAPAVDLRATQTPGTW